MMIKKLTKLGNSHAVLIDRAVLDLLKIDVDTPIELTTNGNQLILSPIRDDDRFKKALVETNELHAETFKRLAEQGR